MRDIRIDVARVLNIQDLDFGDFFDEFLWMSHKVWLCYYVVEAYSRSN